MKVNFDCRFYFGNKPCIFHKQDGRFCDNCKNYQKIDKRILIIKLDALGDVIRTTSILPALGEKFLNSQITWVTKKNSSILLKNNSYIQRVFEVEENYLEILLNEKFDIGICLDVDLLSATIFSLAHCKEKYGFKSNNSGQVIPVNKKSLDWYLMGINDRLKRENRKTYQEIMYEICELKTDVKRPQVYLDEESKKFAEQFFRKNNLDEYHKIIGINTGGGKRWQLKKWTLANYIELIRLIKKNHQKAGIILFGGSEEVAFNQKIKEEVGTLIIDAGCGNSILQFAALINLVHVFFTPDSLGMHIGVALNKDSIVIVGPTSPWELDVFGNGEILYSDTCNCIACYLSTCDREVNCMNTITPKKVIESIKKYL